jgi:pyrroline-5-carboxylate reductase
MTKIAFIGAGNMNAAIIRGLIAQGVDAQSIIVSNPSPEKRIALADELGIQHTDNNNEAAAFADFVILGVKPHFITDVCQELVDNLPQDKRENICYLSVAAGLPIEKMQDVLGQNSAIIRTMPNTPSQLGLGMTGLFANTNVTTEQAKKAEQLMQAAGEVVWVDNEEKINDITAVSGSGPAYFFLFMEAMEQQAKAFGFSDEICRKLVQQTALGAANMVVSNSDLEIGQLRANVTSKGGTTHAALTTLIDGGLTTLVGKAMNAALARAQEMSK